MSVLIVKLGALGDVVMATGVVRAIQDHHADSPPTLLTADDYADLFRNWTGLRVAAFPRRGWRPALAMLRFVRRGRFSRIYDLQSNDRSGVLCAMSGAVERVGNHPRFPYTHHPATAWQGQCHIVERLHQVLRAAGITGPVPGPHLPIGAAEQSAVDRWLRDQSAGARPLVLLHAGSSPHRPEKRWPHFAALAAALRHAGLQVAWIGGAVDVALNRALLAAGDINAGGCFSVLELAALGQRARFAVTGDSGPMHVLASTGLPVYGLFGASSARRNHAVGQQHNVIDAGTAPGQAATLAALPVERVLQRLRADGRLA